MSLDDTFSADILIAVIFCSISDAIQFYPNLIEKFLGSVISQGDNFFAALNSIKTTFTKCINKEKLLFWKRRIFYN